MEARKWKYSLEKVHMLELLHVGGEPSDYEGSREKKVI